MGTWYWVFGIGNGFRRKKFLSEVTEDTEEKIQAESSKLKVERLQINKTTNDVSAVPNL
ncbi:hypothetical protein D3OALGA1CA_616 [Olavius algarvensis associated proteobacterium Delta 3]|nr:hypothetical protein D3OALGA1CA_616 [Olavius algarvensis associated proteobacterium Delta 3]